MVKAHLPHSSFLVPPSLSLLPCPSFLVRSRFYDFAPKNKKR